MNDLSMTWRKAANLQHILDTYKAEHRHADISHEDFKKLMVKAVTEVYGSVSNCSKSLESTNVTIRNWMADGCRVRTTRFTVRNLVLKDTQAKLDALTPPAQ
jgi:hypothetical protein